MTLRLCSILFFSLFSVIDKTDSSCLLSLNKDFGNPAPVYLKNGRYLSPNQKNGDISVQRSAHVTVACPGDKRYIVLANVTQNYNVAEAVCVSGKNFRMGGWEGEFKDIACNGPPWFTSVLTKERCHAGNKMYKVGYEIQNNFYSLYETCLDSNLLNTLYVKHELSPASKFLQNGGKRPQFIEGGLFGKVRMSELYKTKNQKTLFNTLLGADKDQEYITKTQFLTRGHLAPRADFPLRAAQRASFHYVNTGPQWMRGNAGDWAALENGLRRRTHSLNSTLTIYTGTHGVSYLENSDGRPTDLYLSTDANNNNIVPIPLYFYKVVYDPRQKTAIALVQINSSYYNQTVVNQLSFCNDVCEGDNRYSWLTWRSDGTHSFCCSYEEFTKKIKEMPRLDVVGTFF